MVDLTQPNSFFNVINPLAGGPAIRLLADNIGVIIANSARVSGLGGPAPVIAMLADRGQIENYEGSHIDSLSVVGLAIEGAGGSDTIINSGRIDGRVALGAGDDHYIAQARGTADFVDLGIGDDRLTLRPHQDLSYFVPAADGGAGRDTIALELGAPSGDVYLEDAHGFEGLVVTLAGAGSNATATVSRAAGFETIDLAASADGLPIGFVESDLSGTLVRLNGGALGVFGYSTLGDVQGSATDELVQIGVAEVAGRVDLGGGDDRVYLYAFDLRDGNAFALEPGACVLGGAGSDLAEAYIAPGGRVDFTGFTGFERFLVRGVVGTAVGTNPRAVVAGLPAGATLEVGGQGAPEATVFVIEAAGPGLSVVLSQGGAIEVPKGVTIASLRDGGPGPTVPAFAQSATLLGDVLGDITMASEDDTVRLRGYVGGAVRLGAGADRFVQLDANIAVAGGIDAGAGDDRVELMGGFFSAVGPLIDDGAGRDTIAFTASAVGVIIDLEAQRTWDGAHGEALAGFEDAVGSAFSDVVFGSSGANLIEGGGGDDRLSGYGGDDTLAGGDGDDVLVGGGGVDSFDGGTGFDLIDFRQQARAIIVDFGVGGASDGLGFETLVGIEGAIGTAFADAMFGGAGGEWFDGGAGGADTLLGFSGDDTVSHGSSAAGVIIDLAVQRTWDGTHLDVLSSIENAVGSAFDDQVFGSVGNNVIDGGAGGADALFGGGGRDTAAYAASARGVIIDLAVGASWDGVVGDRLDGFTDAVGSAFDDQLYGDAAGNRLDGGPGADVFYGNGGADVFVLRRGEAAGDRLMDAQAGGGDRVQLVGFAGGSTLVAGAGGAWTVTDGGTGVGETFFVFGPVPSVPVFV